MTDEYSDWEHSIRETFIQLGDYMNQHSNPIEFLIDFAWANGADRFVVNNAKDQYKKLTEDYLNSVKELETLKNSLAKPVAYARINDRGDLYDLRLQNNPHNDQSTVVPLYRSK